MPVSDNWEVRNRYIETGSDDLGIGCAVTAEDGEGVIEHVYIKSTQSSDTPAIWVDPNQHRGHLRIKNVHIEGHADNAIYAELHPPHGKGGTLTIEDCYLHDNTRGNLRVNGGTEIRNTHVHNTGENFPTRGYPSYAHYSWYEGGGEIHFRHCQIDVDGSDAKHGSSAQGLRTRGTTPYDPDYGSNIPQVYIDNCQIRGSMRPHDGNFHITNTGENPEINPPAGVPMTAEEAENGESSADGPTWEELEGTEDDGDSGGRTDPDLPNTLTITSTGTGKGEYEFEVSGETSTTSSSSEDHAEDGVIRGSLGPKRGTDKFRFSGDIEKADFNKHCEVELNGESYTQDDENEEDNSDDDNGGDNSDGKDDSTPEELELTIKVEGEVDISGDIEISKDNDQNE